MLISDFKYGLFKYEVKDYYAILGVPISANPKQMRQRYMKLAYKLHPDTNHDSTPTEKVAASELLSKIVNPAYENLQKPKLRKECELIISEIGNRLAPNIDKVTISSDTANKLLQEEQNKLQQIYEETIEKISQEQYTDFSKLTIKVGLLSELNMVYLIRQKQFELGKVTGGNYQKKPVSSVISSVEGVINRSSQTTKQSQTQKVTNTQANTTNIPNETENESPTVAKQPMSRLEMLIESANRNIEIANYEPAVFDLREAVKIDSDSAVAHALLGLVYLEQSNLTYARIHINRAVKLDGDNPQVEEIKEKLTKVENKGKKSAQKKDGKSKTAKKDNTAKKSKDDKGKKEPPKIFGIPLW